MSSNVQERTKVTRNAILDAAEEVFLANGFEGGSLSSIARIAGMDTSLISHHFGSKQGLIEDTWARLHERYYERQLHEYQRLDDGERGIMPNSITAYFSFLKTTPGAVRLAAWIFLAGRNHPFPPSEELVKGGIPRIKSGQDHGVFRSDIPAEFIWASFISLAHHWFPMRQVYRDILGAAVAEGEDLDDAYLQAILKIFFEGVRPSGADGASNEN